MTPNPGAHSGNAGTTEGIVAPIVWADATLIHEVSQFLFYESELLDGWRLDEWFALFTPDCQYLVPATDRPDGDADIDLFFVRDDWFLLSQRVSAIMDGTAWTESPRSITKRIVSNIRAHSNDDGSISVKFNFLVSRSTAASLDFYPGECQLTLVRGGHAGFEIKFRRSTLALAQLRPHGRVSVIL
jgi:p-cumate 2,3-dioxygenase subunit beta